MSPQNIIDTAKMSEYANGGLAILSEGLDNAIVANTMRLISLKRCH